MKLLKTWLSIYVREAEKCKACKVNAQNAWLLKRTRRNINRRTRVQVTATLVTRNYGQANLIGDLLPAYTRHMVLAAE